MFFITFLLLTCSTAFGRSSYLIDSLCSFLSSLTEKLTLTVPDSSHFDLLF